MIHYIYLLCLFRCNVWWTGAGKQNIAMSVSGTSEIRNFLQNLVFHYDLSAWNQQNISYAAKLFKSLAVMLY